MRRPAPALPVSSKLLKHFAAATVVITSVLALFAGGEDAGVAAQVQAKQARNDLVAAEQEKLGNRQIVSTLRQRGSNTGSFGEDGGSEFGAGSGGGGAGGGARSSGVPMPQARGPAFLPPAGLAGKPGGSITRKGPAKSGGAAAQEDADGGFSAGAEAQAGRGGPDTSNLGTAIEASRMRSGSSERNGD